MRLAFDATALPPQAGGAGNYILRLVRALGDLQLDDNLYVFVKAQDVERFGCWSARVEPVVVRLESRPRRLAWEQTGLPSALRRMRVDLLHSPHYTVPLAAPSARVVTFHDMIFFLFPEYHQRLKAVFFRSMIRAAARLADHVVTDSDSTRADACRLLRLDPARVTTVHLAAAEEYRPVDDQSRIAQVEKRYGLEHPFILTVCTLEPRKNLVSAVRVLSELQKMRPGVQLAIVGAKGWDYQGVFDEIRRLAVGDRVRWVGYAPREELPALYSACDVFLYPSLYEGFGLPPLEAMACGAPVIVSNRSSLPEVVADGGIHYDPDNEGALTQVVADLLCDAGARSRWRGRALARARVFSWNETARRTYEIYHRVVLDHSRRN